MDNKFKLSENATIIIHESGRGYLYKKDKGRLDSVGLDADELYKLKEKLNERVA